MVTLSVFFDSPFWVGVLEIQENGELRAVRFVFGSEPTDPELYEFLMRHGVALLERAEAAPPVSAETREARRPNPKRAAKLASRAVKAMRSTASQEAMRLELESRKREAAADRKALRRAADEQRREVARRKRIERKRDR
ncbi:YjdF family protein [Microtetraspora niveoalba]|uniref:YjdF family protein n=1 Tax=Microtetraspora niveoalba TaxID=46175 RepID=UPI0008321F80|nr:YjdF family protein [Microtetraspora niveoalba]